MRPRQKKTYLIYESAFRGVDNIEDLRIIELFFERNEQAVTETEAKYGKLCHSIAFNILNNKEDAEECVNDSYAAIWNAIPPTRPNSLGSFVCKITRNISLKRLEFLMREKRRSAVLPLTEFEELLPDERYAPNAKDEDVGKLISAFLRTQKTDARKVFIGRYFLFESVKDIAKRYSFTESKVKNMLLRTRNKLKDYLIKEGVEI